MVTWWSGALTCSVYDVCIMEKPPKSPPLNPHFAAGLGFLIAAVAGTLASVAWLYWRQAGEILGSVQPGMRSGSMAFSLNIPGFSIELVTYFFGASALVALGGTWIWRPATLRTWYSV